MDLKTERIDRGRGEITTANHERGKETEGERQNVCSGGYLGVTGSPPGITANRSEMSDLPTRPPTNTHTHLNPPPHP